MKRIKLTESELKNVIGNIVHEIISEAKSIKSKKLQDILSKHGGLYKSQHTKGRHFRNYVIADFHNMSDDDVIGVMDYKQIQDIQYNYGSLYKWAKENNYPVSVYDDVDSEKLGDGNYLIIIYKNAKFESSKQEGGWKDVYDKREKRRRSNRNDDFQAMTPKGKAARELRTTVPYYWAAKRGEFKDPQSGWTNPERRKQAMDFIRQGKDAWGYEPR